MMKYYIFALVSQASLWFMAGLKFQDYLILEGLERVSIALIMSVLLLAMFSMATEEAEEADEPKQKKALPGNPLENEQQFDEPQDP